MKKKIAAVVITSALFAGTVSASGINGNYNGNPIVKVKVNGSLVDSEVPAQIIDGSTLIPLRSAAAALGTTVKWDADTYTAELTKTTNNDNIINLKKISYASNVYKNLEALGENFYISYLELYFALSEIEQSNGNTFDRLSRLLSDGGLYKETVNQYNEEASEAGNNIDFVKTAIDISDINSILINYHSSIEQYNSAIESMKVFIKKPTVDLRNQITNGLDKAFATGNNSLRSSKEKYNSTYNYLLSLK